MTLDSKSPDCACKCSRCGAIITKDRDADLAEIMKILEVVPTRAEAPNANVCRAALKSTFGSRRARYLIDSLLEDRTVPATKAYCRRHIMMIDRKPLRPKIHDPEEPPNHQSSEL